MSAFVLGVDTNVLVRFFVRDDEKQFMAAEQLIAQAERGGLFANVVTLVELNWVLRRAYKYTRDEVMVVLQGMTEFSQFQIGSRELVLEAMALSTESGADFSDALISLLDKQAGCKATVTFDHKALRLPDMMSVKDAVS